MLVLLAIAGGWQDAVRTVVPNAAAPYAPIALPNLGDIGDMLHDVADVAQVGPLD
jgi:hypothetical protein